MNKNTLLFTLILIGMPFINNCKGISGTHVNKHNSPAREDRQLHREEIDQSAETSTDAIALTNSSNNLHELEFNREVNERKVYNFINFCIFQASLAGIVLPLAIDCLAYFLNVPNPLCNFERSICMMKGGSWSSCEYYIPETIEKYLIRMAFIPGAIAAFSAVFFSDRRFPSQRDRAFPNKTNLFQQSTHFTQHTRQPEKILLIEKFPLYKSALIDEDNEKIKEILQFPEGIRQVNQRYEGNNTLWHLLVDKEKIEMIKLLNEKVPGDVFKAGMDIQNDMGDTAWHRVIKIRNGSSCKAKLLNLFLYYAHKNKMIEHLLNQVNRDQDNAFHIAVKQEDIETVKQLIIFIIKHNIPFNLQATNGAGYTPLQLAIGQGNKILTKLFLIKDQGKSLSVSNKRADAPFHLALQKRDNNMLSHLVALAGTYNQEIKNLTTQFNKQGEPLFYAVVKQGMERSSWYEDAKIIELLLEEIGKQCDNKKLGSIFHCPNKQGDNLWHLAIKNSDLLKLLSKLALEKGIDKKDINTALDHTNNEGKSAREIAKETHQKSWRILNNFFSV